MWIRSSGGYQVAGLVASAVTLLLAPRFMPVSYSWVAHTTSESAAQGVPGAWLARVGLTAFGATVVSIAVAVRTRWGSWAVGLHALFGLLLVAAAVFSARSWDETLPYSSLEDLVHSVAATLMGFAFAIGVTVVALGRWRQRARWGAVDLLAVTASVGLPLGMAAAPAVAGALQRAMFAIAYLWYGLEAVAPPHRAPGDAAVP